MHPYRRCIRKRLMLLINNSLSYLTLLFQDSLTTRVFMQQMQPLTTPCACPRRVSRGKVRVYSSDLFPREIINAATINHLKYLEASICMVRTSDANASCSGRHRPLGYMTRIGATRHTSVAAATSGSWCHFFVRCYISLPWYLRVNNRYISVFSVCLLGQI